MPFPLRALSHDLQLRLCDISAPTEVYQFQIASGDVPTSLRPVRELEKYNKLRLKKSLNVDYLRVFKHLNGLKQIEVDRDRLYEVSETLWLDSFRDGDEADWFFDHLFVNCTDLRFVQCQVGPEFLKNIAARFMKPVKWFCQTMTSIEHILSFGEIFHALPDVDMVICDTLFPGWLKNITDANKTGLKFLQISGSLRDFLTFTGAELTEFFLKQDKNFVLEWHCTDSVAKSRKIPKRIQKHIKTGFVLKIKPSRHSRMLRIWCKEMLGTFLQSAPTCYQCKL